MILIPTAITESAAFVNGFFAQLFILNSFPENPHIFSILYPTPHTTCKYLDVYKRQVYNRAEAKKIVADNPMSFLKIDRAETQFPDTTDLYAPEVYARARDTLQDMLGDGAFIR